MSNILIKIAILTFCLTSTPTFAQQSPPYDTKLLRLAEILGALHSLQNLCSTPTNHWYDYMNLLIEAEKPTPQRRAYFYEAFNETYRAFSENYHRCTKSAIESHQRYVKEGKFLSENLLMHLNN
ncbi:TIGR02301 family protein [Bartonella henselae]|uniref:TIGR02301 family protein n=1 Tax=Bartonella henselae (strain ATCC 49882 / DSM 28221 / CCUG 30454 / Houston 1) TaxID=283166 RepID=A0A0H3LXV8_BARHE|nr:TIGR02301 family protein [Bartonella henselae]ATP12123.1 TIGR02301 family protein [Bartonella henselae]ETS07912.1 TIGR02301 family protein [Bartonella henselae JK 42]ETS09922.1 TIGR02301 family protein [Bartonella henselae JK 50]ETS10432.1 TIGR02301 family protein [Bartonella henselae JK 51]ETS12328.1 TIGR02301 family protein [Bartonella henselae JK 41]